MRREECKQKETYICPVWLVGSCLSGETLSAQHPPATQHVCVSASVAVRPERPCVDRVSASARRLCTELAACAMLQCQQPYSAPWLQDVCTWPFFLGMKHQSFPMLCRWQGEMCTSWLCVDTSRVETRDSYVLFFFLQVSRQPTTGGSSLWILVFLRCLLEQVWLKMVSWGQPIRKQADRRLKHDKQETWWRWSMQWDVDLKKGEPNCWFGNNTRDSVSAVRCTACACSDSVFPLFSFLFSAWIFSQKKSNNHQHHLFLLVIQHFCLLWSREAPTWMFGANQWSWSREVESASYDTDQQTSLLHLVLIRKFCWYKPMNPTSIFQIPTSVAVCNC